MWETEQIWDTIDFHSIYLFINGAPKPPGYKPSSKYLHLSLGKTKKFIQVGKSKWRNFYFGVNNPFNHTSHYFNINLIGPSMILKEYSAVAVVKCASDWQINCIYISVVFYCVDISVNILICTFSWTTLFKDCPRDSGCCSNPAAPESATLHSLPNCL